jgi:coenzyme F420-reducing hydrogenase alpha subunit
VLEAYQARLAAVAEATAALRDGRVYPIQAMGGAGIGVAQVRTARGVLTHAAELADGVVSRYQVWAPTDVFFGDETALAALLAGQCWGNLDQMRQGLNQAILALDPCLPYVMELNDA